MNYEYYKYYTYRIDFADGCYYYGQKRRKDNTPPEQDGYYGSPVTNKRKWLDNICCKTILFMHENVEEAGKTEVSLIGNRWLEDPKCLNASSGGINIAALQTKGTRKSEETKRKMSEAKKGRKLTEEHKRKLSEAKKGRKLSKETRRRMSESSPRRRYRHSEETRRKMSLAKKGKPGFAPNKGKPMSEEQKIKISEAHQRRRTRKRAERDQLNDN